MQPPEVLFCLWQCPSIINGIDAATCKADVQSKSAYSEYVKLLLPLFYELSPVQH